MSDTLVIVMIVAASIIVVAPVWYHIGYKEGQEDGK